MSRSKSNMSAIAKRYAKALFDEALDTKAGDAKTLTMVHQELTELSGHIHKNADLAEALSSQTISQIELNEAIMAIAKKAKFSKTTTGFLAIVSENKRLSALDTIIQKFFELVEAYNQNLEAKVTSAIKLGDDHLKEIQKILKKKYQKNIKISQTIDKNIIGGLVVQVESVMFDNSIKNKIRNLRLTMKEAE